MIIFLNKISKDIFSKFKKLPHSNHIASEFAILGLLKIIKKYNPKFILEVGVGIGTLTYTIIIRVKYYEITLFELITLTYTILWNYY